MRRALLAAVAIFRFGPLWWLIRKARKYGTLTMQETALEHGQGWHCQLRAHAREGMPRYAWTAYGYSMGEAIGGALADAKDWPIGALPEVEHAPKLGGAEFDPE